MSKPKAKKQKRTRGQGEGSIHQRGDGKWVGTVEGPRTPTGRRRRPSIVRHSRQEVVDGMAALKARVAGGVPASAATTVGDYLDFWLTEVKAPQVGASSLTIYTDRINRVRTHIGKLRLDRVNKGHIQSLANELAKTYAPTTCADTLGAVRAAFQWAVPELLPRNPAQGVHRPRRPTGETDDALTKEERDAVLSAAAGDDHFALYWLALKLGLRIGELIELRWSNVNLKTNELLVLRSSTKTDAGERKIPLRDDAIAVLTAHRRRQKVGAIDGLVFVNARGTKLDPRRIGESWTALLTKAGVQHKCWSRCTPEKCSTSVRRFHAARHTAAILMLEAGVALEVVSAILGHRSISITADIYIKVRANLMRKGLDAAG